MSSISKGPVGERSVVGDGKEDGLDAADAGDGAACVSLKSILRFTFCEVRRSASAARAIASRCFPVGVAVGVRSCPAKNRSLAICSGLRFFRGEGFVGSWLAVVEVFPLRRVTLSLMARVVSVGSSASEIGVVGRECRLFAVGELVKRADHSWLQVLSRLFNSCEMSLGGDLNLGFSGVLLANVQGFVARSLGGVDVWLADGAFRVRVALASAGSLCFCAFWPTGFMFSASTFRC